MPCGTPDSTQAGDECTPSMTTCWVLPERKDFIQPEMDFILLALKIISSAVLVANAGCVNYVDEIRIQFLLEMIDS